jgi:outer membrane lipoprotein-sorting protein
MKALCSIKILLLMSLLVTPCVANELLAHISRQLIQSSITQGKFQQEKQLKFLTKPLISNGLFIYHQKQGVIWQTESPLQSILLMNESTMLTGEEKQAVPPALGHVFKALLGGEMDQLTDHFVVTGKQQGMSWSLQLAPKDEFFKKVITTINVTGDSEIRNWELHESGGNVTRIHFTDISHPSRLGSEHQSKFEKLSP